MHKKGQIELSFGMIFSVIIIIATVVVAFYMISKFMSITPCTKAGLFYDSLRKEVDNAWQGTITQSTFKGDVPSDVSKVCFGNTTQKYSEDDSEAYEYAKMRSAGGNNVFFYPGLKTCDIKFSFYKLEHATTDSFFCVAVKSEKMSVRISKGSSDVLVKLSKP